MKYDIVCSSSTGNTSKLAEEVKKTLPQERCLYFGTPDIGAVGTNLVFVGFWTNQGSCDAIVENFLKGLQKKQVFLFGTAGFGVDAAYFEKVLASTSRHLNASNKVIGSFMCQGKMSISVRERYEKMLTGGDGDIKTKRLIQNFDLASTHPDGHDLEQLKARILEAVSKL